MFSFIIDKLASDISLAYISFTFFISFENLILLNPDADKASKIVIGGFDYENVSIAIIVKSLLKILIV